MAWRHAPAPQLESRPPEEGEGGKAWDLARVDEGNSWPMANKGWW